MKKILFILTLVISSFAYGQLPSEEIVEANKFNCDARILLHYSNEEILAMDSLKFENIKYYYCNSYSLDTSNVPNYDINSFDISIYEDSRKENEFYTFEIEGLIITLFPRNTSIYLIDNKYKKNKRHE